jgi:NADH-quinone oxidoreductase subunit G
MPRLVIDDLEVEVPKGTKVIEAAERLGIVIPRFCYHEALGSVGACRMCAVKFVQGPFKGVQMSCMIDAQDGMVVSTTDEEAVQFRKRVIELLMMNHPLDCPVCDEGGQCLLQDETWSSGHGIRRYRGKKRTYRDQYLGPFIQHEMNRCIHCYRCSRYYQEFAGYRDLGPMQIGDRIYFGRFSDGKLESPFSGNLVDICPTGVYTDKTARFKVRRWDLQRAPSLCNQCSLGCNTIGNAYYRGVMRVEARFNHDVNGYFICDAGRFGFSYTNGGEDHKGRPWFAMVDGKAVCAKTALGKAAEALGRISQKYGPGAIAAIGSHRNSLETQCMLKRICRTKNWVGPVFFSDPARRRKTRSAVECLDLETAASMREIENADFIVIVGADPVNEAGMAALAIRQASRKKAPVVVIDPRPVELPFDFELIPAAPGEIELYLAAIVAGAVKKDAKIPGKEAGGWTAPGVGTQTFGGGETEGDRTTDEISTLREAAGFYRALMEGCRDLELPSRTSFLSECLSSAKRPVIVCGTDVTRETTPAFAADCVQLLRAAGKDARLFYILQGAGSFGSALMSGLSGPDLTELIADIEKGAIRALLVAESDPFHYYPDRSRLDLAISKLEVLIAIDYLPTETVNRAAVFCPSSTIFETGSTYINQEGRVQFARRVHHGGMPIWGGEHPERVYGELVPGADHLPAWRALGEIAGDAMPEGEPGKIFPGGFFAAEHSALEGLAQGAQAADGMRILPGKSGREDRWKSLSAKSGKRPKISEGLELLTVEWMFGTTEFSAYSDSIKAGLSEPHMAMNSKDAQRAGLCDGDRVLLELDGGELETVVCVSDRTAEGVLIVPRHQSLDWRKMRSASVWVPPEKIRKTGQGA